MKRLTTLIALLIASTSFLVACCAERDYRLFPVGELSGEVIFIEFDLSRNCRLTESRDGSREYYVVGTVRLVQSMGDSLLELYPVDTLDITECACTDEGQYQKTVYEKELANSYQKALNLARQQKGFKPLRPTEIVFNDTLNTVVTNESTDSTYVQRVKYKDFTTIELDGEEIISCFPETVAEVRAYESEHIRVTVLRLRCQLVEEAAISRNQKRFASIETAFWKEKAQWHGIAKDYWIVEQIEE